MMRAFLIAILASLAAAECRLSDITNIIGGSTYTVE
jgi:hypothetical protein